jgi:hypothetical protein
MNTPGLCSRCKKMYYNVVSEDFPDSSAWCNAGWNQHWGDPNCPHFIEGDIDVDLSFRELRENDNVLIWEERYND